MSNGPCEATPATELRRQIISSSVPKNEREHWAARHIVKLEDTIEMLKDEVGAEKARADACSQQMEAWGVTTKEQAATINEATMALGQDQLLSFKLVDLCKEIVVKLNANIQLRHEVEEQRDRLISDLEKLGTEIEWLTGKRNVLRTALIKCFVHLGNEISRMTLNESAANGTQELSATIAEILDLDNDRRVSVTDQFLGIEKADVKIDEGDRQMIILALAKLTFTRPGWKYALTEVAKSLHGEAMFNEFVKHGPDQKS